MSDFNFNFVLLHANQRLLIKPPLSFFALKGIAEKRFSSNKITNFYQEEEEIQISNESNYFDFLNWAESSNLKEIEIEVKSGQPNHESKKANATAVRYVTHTYKLPLSNHCDYLADIDTINGIWF